MPLKNGWRINIQENLARNPASGNLGDAVSVQDREEMRRRYRQWQAPGARFAALARAALVRDAREALADTGARRAASPRQSEPARQQ
jgi:hypothetical protein